EPLIISRSLQDELDGNLLLFYTGLTHSAGEILKEQSANVSTEEEKFRALIRMTDLAWEMREALAKENLDRFGEILNENWVLKKSLSRRISNATVEKYYQIALESGALGGKLLGAGGGGFLLFYCPKEKQSRLRSALSQLVELPFSIEQSGTKVIYVGEKNWD
nr:GHMP kinase [Clostridiales bacterium]